MVVSRPGEGARDGATLVKAALPELYVAELDALVATAAGVHGLYGRHVFGPLIQAAAWTGLRPGELFALFPSDVDLDQRRIRVSRAVNAKTSEEFTKTEGGERTVPLLPEAEEAFRRLLGSE